VRDSNVPYRLMKVEPLKPLLEKVTSNFFLTNVLVSVLVRHAYVIKWVPIFFRKRYYGEPKINPNKFAKIAWNMFLDLKKLKL
jgi:hypothetical protein